MRSGFDFGVWRYPRTMSAQTRVVDILVGLQIADILDEQQRGRERISSGHGRIGLAPIPERHERDDSLRRSA